MALTPIQQQIAKGMPVHPECKKCIKRQLEKYDGFVDANNRVYDKFAIACTGIPEYFVNPKLKQVLTEDEYNEAVALYDPVAWAKYYGIKLQNGLEYEERDYQSVIMRCTAKRRVSRLGRRCLAKGTKIMTPNGPEAIENLKPGDIIYGYNPDTHLAFETPVVRLYDQGIQEVVDLMHCNNRVASCTPDHRWHVSTYWGAQSVKRLHDLVRGDRITHAEGRKFELQFDLNKTYKAHTYDIEIDTPDHLFLTADGLVSHNTGKTTILSLCGLHFAMTQGFKTVTILSPRKSQTEEIIERMRMFLDSNPELRNSVTQDKASPFFKIKFNNGSKIYGMTSGTASNSEAVGARGQDSDFLILDEADYFNDNDLDALLPILATNKNVRFWASSTPTGRRGHFWRWCTKMPTYKEFHGATTMLPHWEEIKDEITSDFIGRPDAWEHEIMANFGEEAVGVFQHQYIETALHDIAYEEQVRKPGWTYSIGVDWNDDHGTEIFVTGYDGHGRFYGVDAFNVAKAGWSQLAGLEAIVKMNAKWHPEFIYVDYGGGGSTHQELLQMHGVEAARKNPNDPAVRLQDIVKTFDFGSSIEIYDPLTQQPIKKRAKVFMVENAVRRFEEGAVFISEHDPILRAQLENYIIKNRSPNGVPTYGLREPKVGDHRLDAFMLSHVAFKLEKSDFGKPQYSSRLIIAPGFANNKTKEEIQKGATKKNYPQSRFEQERPITIFGTLPAKARANKDISDNRPGWIYDMEEEYERQYQLRKRQKLARQRRNMPSRSNI